MGMQMLLMATGNTGVSLTPRTIADYHGVTVGTASATTTFELNSDGVARGFREQLSDEVYNGEWLVTGTNSSYEVMFTVLSGATPTGTLNTWLNLGTTRSVTVGATRSVAGVTSASSDVQVQIRTTSGLLVVTTVITISATAEFIV